MINNNSEDKGSVGSIPLLGAETDDLDFRSWHTAMSASIVSLTTDYNLLVDAAPPPGQDLLAIAQMGNANQRRVAEALKTQSDVWIKGQKRASSLLLTAVAKNKNATNILSRQRTEAVVVPPLRAGEHLPIADMLNCLYNHYIPVNELRAIKAENEIKRTILQRNEPLTKFLVRFEHGLELARAQGKNFTLIEQKALLDKCLRSGEKVMDNVINTLQMNMAPMTWVEVTSYLSRYDDTEMGSARILPSKPRGNNLDSVAFIQGDKKNTNYKKLNQEKKNVVCSSCNKRGHDEKNCWKAHPEKLPEKFKKKRKSGADNSSEQSNNKRKRGSWPQNDGDGNEVSMLSDNVESIMNIVSYINDDSCIFLDSCASRTLLLLNSKHLLTDFRKTNKSIGTADKSAVIQVTGIGVMAGEQADFCPSLRRPIVSLGRVHKWGLTAKLPPEGKPMLVDKFDNVLLEGEYILSMPCFELCDIYDFLLSRAEVATDTVCAVTRLMEKKSDKLVKKRKKTDLWSGDDCRVLPQKNLNDQEKMQLFHNRMGHVFCKKLVDGYMRMLYSGFTIPRSMIRPKGLSMMSKCSSCYKSKQKRISFHPSDEFTQNYLAGECLYFDLHMFINCIGYDKTCMRANYTDAATGVTLSYGLESSSQLIDTLDLVLHDYHLKYGFVWKYLHSDQERGLEGGEVATWLAKHRDIQRITSPTDTPELNGVAEGVNKLLGQMTLSMLTHSGREPQFWPGAYNYAVQIKLVLPAKTVQGWMSPFEFITKRTPNVSHFRVWGSKCFVLEPRNEHRKDWHPKSVVGFFLSLSTEPIGYDVWVPELRGVVTAVNVEFDEVIPDPGVEYHESLKNQLLPISEAELSISQLRRKYIKKHFVDDESGLLYEVVNIRMLKDRTLIADVRVVGDKKMARQPFHVAEMMRLVDEPVNRESVIKRLTEELDVEDAKRESAGSSRDSGDLSEVDEFMLAEESAVIVLDSIDALGEEKYPDTSDEKSDCETNPCTEVYNVVMALGAEVDTSARQGEPCSEDVPQNRAAMLRLPKEQRDLYIAAEKRELDSIEKQSVIEGEVPIPAGVKPIGSRFVYSIKDAVAQEGHGAQSGDLPDLEKARLVMKDFKNREDDFRETYAPTGRAVTFRILILLSIILLMTCDHLDVNTAFLYASLVNPLYMSPPTGYPCQAGYCLKVVKALYGCRTAPREWYKVLKLFVISLGFKQSVLDPCLFVSGTGDSFAMIFYVDNILVFTKVGTYYAQFRIANFLERFACKNLGNVRRFNGVWVEFGKDFSSVRLHQSSYCQKIVKKYRDYWEDVYKKPKKTPLPQDIQERLGMNMPDPVTGDDYFAWWDTFPYLQMIGAALYLAINTRPDIMFAVCMLARYSKGKPMEACRALCWLFAYLSGTADIGLVYSSFGGLSFEDILDLFGYSDADWASDWRTRRSTGGYLVYACGGPLAWGSKLMAMIAALSMESKYIVAYFLGQQLLYILNLLSELGFVITKQIPFFMDAMAAIQALRNSSFHACIKHVDIKWHWLRNLIGSIFALHHVRSADMAADLLTKMPTLRVWLSLLPHVLGEELRSSTEVVVAQTRAKDVVFPSGVRKP